MGSGTSKSVVTTSNPTENKGEIKGILKKEPNRSARMETTAWSRSEPGIYSASDDNTEEDSKHIYDAVGADTGEEEKEKADVACNGDEDNDDSLSEGSSSEYCMTTGRPGSQSEESEEDRNKKLNVLHQTGRYHETEFTDAKFKVFNDYLVWATETGSRGERVVIPDDNMKIQQKQTIRDTMAKLEEADSYIGNDELHCLLVLCKMSDVRQKDYVELVTELGYAKLFMKIWQSLHEVNVNDQLANPATYLAISMLLDATQGFTEIGVDLCRDMGTECVGALLLVLYDKFYEVDELNMDSKKLRWMSRREFLKRVLTVLYHCIRHYMDNKDIFREHHASLLLKPYLKCRFLILRVKAIFTLAFIVTEDENAHLNTTNTNIDFIIKILSKALSEPNHYSAHYNFSASQVADAMKYLAAYDDNKLKFVASGALSRIVSMLQDGNPVEEQKSAMEALWTLSFHPKNKNAILKEKGCLEIVREFKKSEYLCRSSTAILWNVGEETHATLTKKSKDSSRKPKPDDRETSPLKSQGAAKEDNIANMETINNNNYAENGEDDEEEEISTNHVMLSYQWDVQKQILKVKELLQADGYKVWMDVDQMGGSTLEAMASAVENAMVVLICFSEKYKNSPACRTEAEYTFKLNKAIIPLQMQQNYKPDGWLGIMIGTKFYIQMSTMDEVISNVDRLKRELAGRGRVPTMSLSTRLPSISSGDGAVAASSKFKRNDSKRQSRREAAKDVASWTNNEVNSWLTRNGLPELKNRLQGYDGEGIMGLKTIANDAPEFFYKEVKTELGLKSLREIIRFKQALDDIL
nr:uncharacterized protein LOC129279601 [Lytechinus pictus]